jgi:hypothetical protein
VLDAGGAAVPGVALALSSRSSKAACTSGAGGWFEIALDVPAEEIVSADERYATVLAGSAAVHDSTQPTVVVAARIDLAGVVLDETGAPLAAAALELELPPGFGAEWGVALDYSLPQRWRALSDAGGRFALDALPAVPGSVVSAALAGFAPHAEDSPLRSTPALEIVLARPRESSGSCTGSCWIRAARAEERASPRATRSRSPTRAASSRSTCGWRERASGSSRSAPASCPRARAAARCRRQTPLAGGGRAAARRPGGHGHRPGGRRGGARPSPARKVWLDDPTISGAAPTCDDDGGALRGAGALLSFERTDERGQFSIAGLLSRPIASRRSIRARSRAPRARPSPPRTHRSSCASRRTRCTSAWPGASSIAPASRSRA